MRRTARRLAAVATATGAFVAVATPASAAGIEPVLTCTASVRMDWSTSGQVAATVTAYVVGVCSTPGWTTCDVSVAGSNVYAGTRNAAWGWCDATVTVTGVQNTPYFAIGRVGYSASDAPTAVATTLPVVPTS